MEDSEPRGEPTKGDHCSSGFLNPRFKSETLHLNPGFYNLIIVPPSMCCYL